MLNLGQCLRSCGDGSLSGSCRVVRQTEGSKIAPISVCPFVSSVLIMLWAKPPGVKCGESVPHEQASGTWGVLSTDVEEARCGLERLEREQLQRALGRRLYVCSQGPRRELTRNSVFSSLSPSLRWSLL